jgi:hypothetical protein
MVVRVLKDVILDFEDNKLIIYEDEAKDTKRKDVRKKLIICPCCRVLFDPKVDDLEYIVLNNKIKRSNKTIYNGSSDSKV